MRKFFDSAVFWVALGGAAAVIGGIFLSVGATRTPTGASVWSDRWFDAGFGVVLIGVVALLWGLVLFLAHSHVDRHSHERTRPTPTLASTTDPPHAGWITPEALSDYLASINTTMEQHGFGRNANTPPSTQPSEPTPDWEELNNARIRRYQENRGLFLVHEYWVPSQEDAGQIADVHVWVAQHADGPLSRGEVRAVEYTLGPKFTNHSIVCMNADESFGMNCSMWAPMLCIAKVYFTNGSAPLLLERYVNFRPSDQATDETPTADKTVLPDQPAVLPVTPQASTAPPPPAAVRPEPLPPSEEIAEENEDEKSPPTHPARAVVFADRVELSVNAGSGILAAGEATCEVTVPSGTTYRATVQSSAEAASAVLAALTPFLSRRAVVQYPMGFARAPRKLAPGTYQVRWELASPTVLGALAGARVIHDTFRIESAR